MCSTPPLTPRRSPRVAAQERGWADVVALNGWLQAAIRCGRLQLALQAFQEAKAADPPLRLDVVTFGTLDGAFNVVVRHILRLRGGNRQSKARVKIGIRSAARSDRKFFAQFRKYFCPLGILSPFAVHDVLKL